MPIKHKIADIQELEEYIKNIKSSGERIVLCQGHFNVIHPGHLRFLEFAKQQGKILIVAIQGLSHLEEKNRSIFFSEEERARSVASLQGVDKVIIFNEKSILDIIYSVKPNVYVRGEEFAHCTDLIKDEINLVENLGGKVVFSSGQVEYSTSEFLAHNLIDLSEKNINLFKTTLNKQKISRAKLRKYCDSFKNQNILVLGDTIVDEYIACDAVGMSAEAPILNIRELESKSFIGGAAIVARHVKALGANCHFISVIGDDAPGGFVNNELQKDGIKTKLLIDNERKTTFKIRYMVGKQKILRVSRLHEHYINKRLENSIKEYLESMAEGIDGIIVSDFAYGVITPELVQFISHLGERHNIRLFGDSQSSSQIGDVAQFTNFDLITPTEREARLALNDKYNGLEKISHILLKKTKVKNLVIKLAEKGFISYENISGDDSIITKSQHFPALTINPVDVMGAGDSLLTGFAVSMCAGADLMEASAIATGIASIAVNQIGNVPVKFEEVVKWIEDLGGVNNDRYQIS